MVPKFETFKFQINEAPRYHVQSFSNFLGIDPSVNSFDSESQKRCTAGSFWSRALERINLGSHYHHYLFCTTVDLSFQTCSRMYMGLVQRYARTQVPLISGFFILWIENTLPGPLFVKFWRRLKPRPTTFWHLEACTSPKTWYFKHARK